MINLENLRLAWQEVAERSGAAGIDRVSVSRWRRNWEERLVALSDTVRNQTYRPRPPRMICIPKKDGSLREISILTVTDRVLQRAFLRVVDDVFDHTFLECSYGYRAGRGLRDAVPAILYHRDLGRLWVVDADIDACFQRLQHAIILQEFNKCIDEPGILRLLRLWLQTGKNTNGIFMGAVISPLLCNIYLNVMDHQLVANGFHLVRYADDFCIFCRSEEDARQALSFTGIVLSELFLQFEPAKTRITHFNHGFDFLGIHFDRSSFRYLANQEQIEVRGSIVDDLPFDQIPSRYEG